MREPFGLLVCDLDTVIGSTNTLKLVNVLILDCQVYQLYLPSLFLNIYYCILPEGSQVIVDDFELDYNTISFNAKECVNSRLKIIL